MKTDKIKIACVGNMNNSFFSVVRHLRHNGYKADLFLVDEFEHFKPQSDTFVLQEISYMIYDINIPGQDILKIDKLKIFSTFEDYDFIIACGLSIAYLTYSFVYIDLIIPYGADFYEVPFFKRDFSKDAYFNLQKKHIARYQKRGIEGAKDILWDSTNAQFEKVLENFQLKGKRHYSTSPFLYTPEFSWKNSGNLRNCCLYGYEMEELRAKFNFIAFNHIRQSWKKPMDEWSQKGNDKIFRAFSKFIKTVNEDACLIVFEYGSDVHDSKILVQELGISRNVIWFPITERRHLMGMISYADIGIGEIGDYGWVSYGAIYEFLAMKKPIIHHRGDASRGDANSHLYPMYDAENEEQVFEGLKECFTNPSDAVRKGDIAHEWFTKTAIEKPINIIKSAIDLKKTNKFKIKKNLKKFLLFFQYLIFYQELVNKINFKLELALSKRGSKTI